MANKHPFASCALLLLTVLFTPMGKGDTLQDAVKTALQLNPDVQTAIDRRWAAEEQLKQQKAGYLPSLDLAGGEGKQNSINPNIPTDDNSITLSRQESSLTLTENLFKGFATQNEVKRMQYGISSAAYKTGGTAEDVALSTTEQYLEVLRHQEFVQLAQHNLQVLQNISQMIKMRTQAGVAKQADYHQAQSRLDLAKDDWATQRGALVDAKTLYKRTVGVFPQMLSAPRPPKPAADLPGTERLAITDALQNNPVLRSATADVMGAQAEHASSKSSNYPSIDLVLNGQRNNNLDGQVGTNNSNEAMVRATWNLYKGGADRAQQRATAYQAQEALDTRNRVAWEVEKNVEISWNAWQEAKERLPYLLGHRDASLATFHSYQLQYKIGQRTLLDVLDAQNEYYQASLSYVTGVYTEMLARYRILNSMGSLLTYLRVPPPAEAAVKMPKGTSQRPALAAK